MEKKVTLELQKFERDMKMQCDDEEYLQTRGCDLSLPC